MSLGHAMYQSYFSVPYALSALRSMWVGATPPLPQHYDGCMRLFMAYITLDSALHWRKLNTAFQVHHALSLAACVQNAIYGPRFIGMCVLANEVSTIFLSAKALLPKPHVLRTACQFAFPISFFATRICMNTLCMAYVSANHDARTIGLMGSICALNGYWFCKAISKYFWRQPSLPRE